MLSVGLLQLWCLQSLLRFYYKTLQGLFYIVFVLVYLCGGGIHHQYCSFPSLANNYRKSTHRMPALEEYLKEFPTIEVHCQFDSSGNRSVFFVFFGLRSPNLRDTRTLRENFRNSAVKLW